LFFLLQNLKNYLFYIFLITKEKNIKKYKNASMLALTGSKLGFGIKIATKSKLRGLKRVVFLGGQNHNFEKLKGSKV